MKKTAEQRIKEIREQMNLTEPQEKKVKHNYLSTFDHGIEYILKPVLILICLALLMSLVIFLTNHIK
jgi:hypothetical protein